MALLPDPAPRERQHILISVDDHVIEPPDMFDGRLPAALADRWHSSAEPLRQPVFESMSFQTQVTVRNGETILLGGSSTPDGERVYYGFLTVTLVDVQSTSRPK